MTANILCVVCETIMGSLKKRKITPQDIEEYNGRFKCDCGGDGILVIVD